MLAWAVRAGRDFPWRHTRDPWAILVSEFMAQQTQLSRVEPKYVHFMARFPGPSACAAAPLGEVLRVWQGLGYPRRAKNLHAAATMIMNEFEATMPRSVSELQRLPGVGPYTARAVAVFAFELHEAVLDTNVGRVLARLLNRTLKPADAQLLANSLVPATRAWAWNQAMLDLGATVCTSRKPRCAVCPVHDGCQWRAEGDDPAAGSAGVSRPQSRFEGSDRQVRGRVLKALTVSPVALGDAGVIARCEPERASQVIESLLADGLAIRIGTMIQLP